MRNVVGTVAQGDDFFVREKISKKINNALVSGNHLLIFGPKNSGLTSLLLDLCNDSEDSFYKVHVNVKNVNSEQLFYERCLYKIRPETDWKHHQISGADFIASAKPREDRKYQRIIIIDGFSQALLNMGDRHAIHLLKELKNARQDLMMTQVQFIFTGSAQLNTRLSQLNATHLLSDVVTIKIDPLSRIEATLFIQHLANNGIFSIADEQISYLLNKLQWLTPYHLQLLFKEITDIAIDKDIEQITGKDIDRAFLQLLDNPFVFEGWHQEIKNLFSQQDYDFVKNLFNALSKQSEVTLSTIIAMANDDVDHKNVLNILIQDGHISTDDNQLYRFSSALLKIWWRNQFTVQTGLTPTNAFDKIKITRLNVQQVKCFTDMSITFDATNGVELITAANARGKTTILQLIALGLTGIHTVPFPYNWKEVVKSGQQQGMFEIEICIDGQPNQLSFAIDSDDAITCTAGAKQLKAIQGTFLFLGYGANRYIKLEDPRPHPEIEAVATLFGENGYLKHIKVSSNFEYVNNNFIYIQPLINAVLEEADPNNPVRLIDFDTTTLYFQTPFSAKLPIEALSEGFKSTFVWLFDMIIRIVEKGGNLKSAQDIYGIVLLDEVDLHLHPGWQRSLVPSLHTTFPNIQFIVSSHSPFVAQSITSDSLTSLELEDGQVVVVSKDNRSEMSYNAVVRDIFNIQSPFSHETGLKIARFREMQTAIRKNLPCDRDVFKALVIEIADKGVELEGVMRREIQSLERRTGEEFGLWTK